MPDTAPLFIQPTPRTKRIQSVVGGEADTRVAKAFPIHGVARQTQHTGMFYIEY